MLLFFVDIFVAFDFGKTWQNTLFCEIKCFFSCFQIITPKYHENIKKKQILETNALIFKSQRDISLRKQLLPRQSLSPENRHL